MLCVLVLLLFENEKSNNTYSPKGQPTHSFPFLKSDRQKHQPLTETKPNERKRSRGGRGNVWVSTKFQVLYEYYLLYLHPHAFRNHL